MYTCGLVSTATNAPPQNIPRMFNGRQIRGLGGPTYHMDILLLEKCPAHVTGVRCGIVVSPSKLTHKLAGTRPSVNRGMGQHSC